MSAVRGLAHDPNSDVRHAAYEAELAGWETVPRCRSPPR